MATPFSCRLRYATILLFVITLLCLRAYAQTLGKNSYSDKAHGFSQSSNTIYKFDRGTNEYGLWGGGSFNSPTLIGTAEDRKFLVIGLRYGRVLATSKHVAYEYTFDVVPLAVVFQPKLALSMNRDGESKHYGFGISPIGFKANFNRENKVKPFLNLSGGFLYFKTPVPIDISGATRFNFTFDFGGGIQFFTNSRQAITLGYKFHHLSNAGRSAVNPGLDANVFYIGFSIFK